MGKSKKRSGGMISNPYSLIVGSILVFFSSWPVREDFDRKLLMMLMLIFGMELINKGFGG
jgi:hypothetical protein